MKITLSDTTWHEVTGLQEDSCYYLQSQNGMIYYTVSATTPTIPNQGIKDTWFKFQKGTDNVYIRALNAPTVVHGEII